MEFKDNFKRIRESKNLTQDYIANEIGISRQSVSKWENGVTEPDLDTIKKLCSIFNCSLNDLIEGESESNSSEIDEALKQKKKNDIQLTIWLLIVALLFIVFSCFLFAHIMDVHIVQDTINNQGMDPSIGLKGHFDISQLNELAIALAKKLYGSETVDASPNLIQSAKTTITSNYTITGDGYWYNMIGPTYISKVYYMVAMYSFIIMIPFVIVLTTALKNNRKQLKQIEDLKEKQNK